MSSIDLPSLGDRMKEYENITRTHLIRRMPAILRLDGRAFHTFTKDFQKPFDEILYKALLQTAIKLMEEIQTVTLCYMQSDEMSFLLKDYTKIETQSWFSGNIQKIVSISAAIASVEFNWFSFLLKAHDGLPVFDARVFNIPKEDVTNYFLWRQQDATRNSINSTGQVHFSHNELLGLPQTLVLDKLLKKSIDWSKTATKYKRGTCLYYENKFSMRGANDWKVTGPTLGRGKLVQDFEMPIITEDRDYIERHVV